jgi:hypothetical protein
LHFDLIICNKEHLMTRRALRISLTNWSSLAEFIHW